MADISRSPQLPNPRGGQRTAQNAPKAETSGLSRERILYLRSLREKVSNGFYNTDPVLEDLSHSFTKAVDALLV